MPDADYAGVRENSIGVTVFGDNMRAYTREWVNTPRWRWIKRRQVRRRGHEMAWLWAWAKGELVDLYPYPPTAPMTIYVKKIDVDSPKQIGSPEDGGDHVR